MSGRSVTVNDVAKRAGVSNATVSRYINKTYAVDPQKALEIDRAIKELGFRINRSARVLKKRCSMQIMMIVPDISNPFYSVAYKTIQDLALSKGYTVALYNTNSTEKNELSAIDITYEMNCDGMIFCSTNDYESVYKELVKFDKPLVASNSFGRLSFDTVHSKKGQGLYLATRHMLELGHKDIAYVGGEKDSILNIRRMYGYETALKEAGIALKSEYIYNGSFDTHGGQAAAAELCLLPNRPTAIVCANDLIAIGVIQALGAAKISVPRDISVSGMDDIEFAKISMPPLTTVKNDSGEFARKCMELIFSRLSGEYEGEPRELLNTRQLLVRESTAPPS